MAKHISGKWSALQDRSLDIQMHGCVSTIGELATVLRALADNLEGLASAEDRLHLVSANVPVSLTIEESN